MSLINLPVPFYSQRDNSFVWKDRYEEDVKNKSGNIIHKKGETVLNSEGTAITENIWDGCCNITCLAMVLNYLGVTKDTPYQMSEKYLQMVFHLIMQHLNQILIDI